jgi:hypothetical protein
LAGCGTSSGGSSPTAPPTSPPTSQPTVAADTAFAAWTERQGFGGSSGLKSVDKLTGWLGDHEYDATLFDLDEDAGDIARLASWLDTHQPTACWADYHAAVRADLTKLAAAYVTTRAAVAAGNSAPADVVASMETTSKAALAMPAPPNCP